MNIAIDGPAGAGKSTIAKELSKKLGILYLDTGAMYRAIGMKVFNYNISMNNVQAIENMLEETIIEVKYEKGIQKIILDGVDVSEKIRENQVSQLASDVSKIKSVRLKMVELQRKIAELTDSILDGRDIGTFVLPNAEYKFYLTASIDERARRRYKELNEKGVNCFYDEIKNDIMKRDKNDSLRDFAPLKKAQDALEIDTTKLSIDEVISLMYNTIMN